MLEKKGDRTSGHDVVEGTYKRKKTRYVARRVIVKLAPRGEGERALDAAMDTVMGKAEGAQVLRSPGRTGRMVLLLSEGESVAEACKKLGAGDDVVYAEPDVVDTAQIVPNDTRYAEQWAPPKVNAEAAWDLETGGSNVIIGIIDSGISMTGGTLDHDDLSTPGRFVLGTDYVDGGTPRDENGHGTHVAGIAGARGNNAAGVAGMSWGSPFYICRTLDTNGNGSSADFADAVEEITDYAVANGLKAVINYSAGGGDNLTKKDACQYASDHGMLVVAATGNNSGNPVIFPAAYSTSITGVVAVGSTDADDTVSSYSNVGPEVTVVAPGRNILSTTPTYTVTLGLALNYDLLSGTSMATPLVSGLAALMWSRHPAHTNEKIKQCLKDTAVELGTGDFNDNWGYGRVDANEAVRCGDVVIAPVSQLTVCNRSILIAQCQPKSQLWLCPASRLVSCPSRLPRLCPTTGLNHCWSELLCVEPTTKLAVCEIRTRVCPSAVDACPSAPGGCEWRPGDLRDPVIIDPRIPRLEARLAALEAERWSSDDDASSEGEGGWFYVDDDGEIHEV